MFDDLKWRIAISRMTSEATKKLKKTNSTVNSTYYALMRKERLESAEQDGHTEQDVLEKWGTDCHICGQVIDMAAPRRVGDQNWEMSLHLDHVIPLVKGGSHTLDNVKPAHALCNITKGARLLPAI